MSESVELLGHEGSVIKNELSIIELVITKLIMNENPWIKDFNINLYRKQIDIFYHLNHKEYFMVFQGTYYLREKRDRIMSQTRSIISMLDIRDWFNKRIDVFVYYQ